MKAKGYPSYINIAPIPCMKASVSSTKSLEKPNNPSTRVVVRVYLSDLNASSTKTVHENFPFLSKAINGLAIIA